MTIITAPAGGATSVFGSDMARVLDDDDEFLFAFFLSLGGGQSATSSISFISRRSIWEPLRPTFLSFTVSNITSRTSPAGCVTSPSSTMIDFHVVAPTSIKSIYDLQGKRIVSSTDVGFYAAKVIFTRLGMNATFDYRTDDGRAVQKIIDGEADAYIGSTGTIFEYPASRQK